MIVLENVTKRYGEKTVIEHLSLVVQDGKMTCLFGPSGSGKTTLLRLIGGLEKPDEGRMTVPHAKISIVFQEDRLLPWFSALDNAALGADKQTAKTLLERLGMGDALSKKPAALSGGMKRRVALSRALAYGGDLLLLDEPFKGLDDELTRTAVAIIKEQWQGKTIVLVTHDRAQSAACDEIINL